ncbi:MAG: HipA N-terminal domain-containing protein [Saprospiraceae bacterium]|nr:HipA N-terminal domain-containing protein [Saprospiraceae bacterium]
MRKAKVFYKEEEAGEIIQDDHGSFTFSYNSLWMIDKDKPAISLTLPKSSQPYHSKFLFPFFFNMLPEGSNKQVACRQLRIDPDDAFGLLIATARNDTIGAVTIKKINL